MNIPAFYRLLTIFKPYIYSIFSLQYYSIVDLQGRIGTNGEKIYIDSYYANGLYTTAQRGAMRFVYKTTQAKSGHNGVTIHSPTVPWDGTQAGLAAYQAKTGETDPSGSGCWVLQYDDLYAYMAGAIGSGVEDDTAALTSALSASDAVFLGGGTFKITSNLNLSGGQEIIGAGSSYSQILVSGDGYDAITLSSNYASIRHVRIYCSSARASGAFVNLNAATHDNFIENFDFQSCYEGITITAAATSTFINNGRIASITPSTGSGIVVAGGNDTFISDLLINSAGTEPKSGINIQKTDAVWLDNIDIINSGNPILVNPDSASGQNVAAIFATNVACDKSDGSALKIAPKGTAIVKWLFWDNCWFSTSDKGVEITTEAGATVDTVNFTNCPIFNNVKQGIHVDNTNGGIKGINIDACKVGGNSTSSSGGYAGIDIGNDVIGFAVRNTRAATQGLLTNKQSYGLRIGTGCNAYVVTGNDFNSNVTGGMTDGSVSTSTIRVVNNNAGHVTRKNANSAITAGNTSVTVTHSMDGTPKTIVATPQGNLAGASYWVSNINSSDFKINVSAAPAGNVTFSWVADVY